MEILNRYVGEIQHDIYLKSNKNLNVSVMGEIIMGSVKWDPICIFCGKKCGGGMTRSENSGAPTSNPPTPSGKCPSSPDGKHKPRWEKT